MKDELKERYPAYVPGHYRLFTKIRKVMRQASVRRAESQARTTPPSGILPDGPAVWTPGPSSVIPNPKQAMNKGAFWMEEDLADAKIGSIVEAIEELKKHLKEKDLRYTNTAATFLPRMFYPRSERTKLWENAWSVYGSGVRSGDRILDVGGASTPFSFYLAELGCDVSVLDNDWGNCGTIYNANYVARKMGWKLKAFDADIAKRFPFQDGAFDKVFSICTIEHLSSPVRRFMMAEVGRVLRPGGIAAITMCYDMNSKELLVDQGLRFGYREKFYKDVVEPSGLSIYGNADWMDFQESGFLGALFLIKPDGEKSHGR